MSGGFNIRPAMDDDAPALVEIFRRSIREIASQHYRPAQIEAWVRFADEADAWRQRMRSRDVWVAETNGKPLGFIQFEPPDHIDLTYVHPEHQRCGVASALLEKIETVARTNGVPALNVEASITSRPFFAARGFEIIAPQIVTARGQEFLNYRMRKVLA